MTQITALLTEFILKSTRLGARKTFCAKFRNEHYTTNGLPSDSEWPLLN